MYRYMRAVLLCMYKLVFALSLTHTPAFNFLILVINCLSRGSLNLHHKYYGIGIGQKELELVKRN